MVFCPKYASRMKYLGDVHVVVLMNQFPTAKFLSKDRFEIFSVREDGCEWDLIDIEDLKRDEI